MNSSKKRKLINIYSGQPRLIKDNWQSIRIMAEKEITLFSIFHLWECPETEECSLFLKGLNLPIYITTSSQPSASELAYIYNLQCDLSSGIQNKILHWIAQYHGIKLAYESAKTIQVNTNEEIDIFFMKCRSDLYIDTFTYSSIMLQLNSQPLNQVTFPSTQFGCGFNDFMWISGPVCADRIFSVVDGMAEITTSGYLVPPEVYLKLYVDKHSIFYAINRSLPLIILQKRNRNLYKKFNAMKMRGRIALFYEISLSARHQVRHENILISIFELLKGLFVDLRSSYILFIRRCEKMPT